MQNKCYVYIDLEVSNYAQDASVDTFQDEKLSENNAAEYIRSLVAAHSLAVQNSTVRNNTVPC